MEITEIIPDWAKTLKCAVTVCDAECKIIFMNELSKKTFCRYGDIIGRSLMEFHGDRAKKMIEHMLATGETNAYTIEKEGVRKIIYQTPWTKNGEIAGLVEISIVLPEQMPHYVR